jgi:hypothetical protein
MASRHAARHAGMPALGPHRLRHHAATGYTAGNGSPWRPLRTGDHVHRRRPRPRRGFRARLAGLPLASGTRVNMGELAKTALAGYVLITQPRRTDQNCPRRDPSRVASDSARAATVPRAVSSRRLHR